MRFKNICSPSELSGQGLVLQVYRQKRKVDGVCRTQDIYSLENYSRDLNECFDREKGGGGLYIYIYDAGILIK